MLRTPVTAINVELTRLGLSGGTDKQYGHYFDFVLYPLIVKYKLARHYKRYLHHKKDKLIDFTETFGSNDMSRTFFCEMIKETETEVFFSHQITKYYGKNIPLDMNGESLFPNINKTDVTAVLLHDKRHVVDGMLAEGFSPAKVSQGLEERYDIEIKPTVIADYAKSFMNLQRKELEVIIAEIQEERESFQEQLDFVRENPEEFSVGERVTVISSLRDKIAALDHKVRGLQSAHSTTSYGEGIMEYSHMREIFTDIMQRSHRRYKRIDERTEDAVIDPLNKLVGMMVKAADKMISIDNVMNETVKKSITDEMLEVIVPTLDRVEEEERAARAEYMKMWAPETGEPQDDEILGDDD
jgi:hypothetical protein